MLVALLLMLSFAAPLVGSIVSLVPYFSQKIKKYSVLFSILVAAFLGIMAYYFQPHQDYDLARHQEIARAFISSGHTASSLSYSLGSVDLEILPQIFMFIVSLTGNLDLMQFIIVTTGYAIMLYMLRDYRQRTNLSNKYFIPITILTICGFYVLYFISGLFFYIAVILFALAVYLDYIKKTNRLIVYMLYLATLFIHDSMIFPVLLVLSYKIFGNKLSIRSILAPALVIVFLSSILGLLADWTGFGIFKNLSSVYNIYIAHNEKLSTLYDGSIFLLEASKLFFTILMVLLAKKYGRNKPLSGFLVIFAICTILALPSSLVMIRFVMPIQILGIVPAMDYFSSQKVKTNPFPYAIMITLAIAYAGYFVYTLSAQNFGDFWGEKVIANPIDLYLREDT